MFLKYCDLYQKENATSTKDWVLDKEELESKFSDKTRAIVINTPHNPVGKVKIKCYSLVMWCSRNYAYSLKVGFNWGLNASPLCIAS